MLHHACQPTHPEPTSQDTLQTLDPKMFISHIRVLNFAGKDYTSHVYQPWTNVAKIHHKTSDPKIFISHIPVLNFAGTTRNRWHHACVPTPNLHHKTSDPKMFISHICFELCRNSSHVTPHMWANPSWTNVPRHTTNFRSEHFHLTHPCFELCRNSSPCYTTHVSQPILYQRPKITTND